MHRNTLWDIFLHVSVIAGAVTMLLLSIEFSRRGFAFWQPTDAWMGYALAVIVTLLEFVFNKGTRNPSLFFICLIAYFYGIYTNIAGFLVARTTDPTVFFAPDVIFAIVAGLLLELTPEPLLLWGLGLERPGDGFFSQLLGLGETLNDWRTKLFDGYTPSRVSHLVNITRHKTQK